MITFAGMVLVFLAEAVFLYYDVNFDQDIPSWAFVYMSVTLLLYQALDAFDGIHARNIRMCSPLGQLFDAGIDAPLHGICVAIHLRAVKMGSSFLGFFYFHSLIV
eukprot:TRINITY_DN122063_c2_g1_i1.p8 TRINITY_DN122063_c2_g1~~TRINITY_DN122063_c2_g1_i1.p8  ORF type:complete len:105 (+),score=12.54 TRINITY_DN122063_c2_g1_i1:375-689(+)